MGAAQTVTNADACAGGIIIAVLGVFLYFVPLIVGALRHVRNLGALAVVNVFAGWTLIGWVVALAMACRTREPVSRSAAR